MTQIVNYYNLTGIISLIIGIVLIGVFKIDAGYLFFTISSFCFLPNLLTEEEKE